MAIADGRQRQNENEEFYDVPRSFTISRKLSYEVTLVQSNASLRNVLTAVKLYNGSGGAITCGVGPQIKNAGWEAGQWDDGAGGNDYTDDTQDAQSSATGTFALQTTTNNDGFVISATERWSSAIIIVGTQQAGGVPVDEWTYWDGSSWNALTTLAADGFSATGASLLLFEPPAAWANGNMPEGVPTGYAIRYRATTAPSGTAALATTIAVGDPLRVVFFDVPSQEFGSYAGPKVKLGDLGEGIQVAFGTAHADNHAFIAGERYDI